MICVEIVSHNSREPLGSSGLWLTIETQIIQNLYGQHFEVIIDYISRQNSPETFQASDGFDGRHFAFRALSCESYFRQNLSLKKHRFTIFFRNLLHYKRHLGMRKRLRSFN